MPVVVKRKEEKPKKSDTKRIEELEQELAKKDEIITALQEQVEFVQLAVDEMILGGMI